MTSREKRLAILVASLALLFGGYMAWDAIHRQLQQRNQAIAGLEKAIGEARRQQQDALEAQRRMDAYRQRSLPANSEIARSLYKSWLLEVGAELGFGNLNVTSSAGPTVYAANLAGAEQAVRELSFRLTGFGTMEQVTRLLHRFYQADQLHRVGQLTLRPVDEGSRLSIDLRADAMILPGAEEGGQLRLDGAGRLAHADVDAYVDRVARRNLFAGTNLPPTLEKIPEQKGQVGQKWELELKVSDPNGGDTLSYELEGDVPEGVTVDAQKAKLECTPQKAGRFAFKVTVKDNGVPPLSATQELVLEVADNADAKATEVTAMFGGARPAMWLVHTASDKRFRLFEGDEFKVESIQGKVLKLKPEHRRVVLEIDGRPVEFAVGQNLTEGKAVEQSDE